MSEVILEINNLKAYYKILKGDVKAVDDISFVIKKGNIGSGR